MKNYKIISEDGQILRFIQARGPRLAKKYLQVTSPELANNCKVLESDEKEMTQYCSYRIDPEKRIELNVVVGRTFASIGEFPVSIIPSRI